LGENDIKGCIANAAKMCANAKSRQSGFQPQPSAASPTVFVFVTLEYLCRSVESTSADQSFASSLYCTPLPPAVASWVDSLLDTAAPTVKDPQLAAAAVAAEEGRHLRETAG
jgi:hypothetical protein